MPKPPLENYIYGLFKHIQRIEGSPIKTYDVPHSPFHSGTGQIQLPGKFIERTVLNSLITRSLTADIFVVIEFVEKVL